MGDGMKRLRDLAATQHGLVERRQLQIAPYLFDYRLRSRAIEHTAFRGVYRIAGATRTWEARAQELLLFCGDGSALSQDTAAYLHGFDGFSARPESFHVLMPSKHLVHAPTHHIHRTRVSKIHATRIDGLPVTSAVLTLIELAQVMKPNDFEKTFDSARRIHKNLEPWFSDFAERKDIRSRPGVAVINALFKERSSSLDSWLEVEGKQRFIAAGLPLPTFGYSVFDAGKFLIKLDGAYLNYNGRNTAVHFDGFGPHSQRRQFERDARQRTRLSVLGWIQVIITRRQLENETAWQRDLRQALGL